MLRREDFFDGLKEPLKGEKIEVAARRNQFERRK